MSVRHLRLLRAIRAWIGRAWTGTEGDDGRAALGAAYARVFAHPEAPIVLADLARRSGYFVDFGSVQGDGMAAALETSRREGARALYNHILDQVIPDGTTHSWIGGAAPGIDPQFDSGAEFGPGAYR